MKSGAATKMRPHASAAHRESRADAHGYTESCSAKENRETFIATEPITGRRIGNESICVSHIVQPLGR